MSNEAELSNHIHALPDELEAVDTAMNKKSIDAAKSPQEGLPENAHTAFHKAVTALNGQFVGLDTIEKRSP